MYHVLKNAVESRSEIRLEYEPGMRTVEPHAFGYGSSGQLLLRVFQTGGASASGEHYNWKLMRIDRLVSAEPTGNTFPGPRPGYRRGDKSMTGGIIAQL